MFVFIEAAAFDSVRAHYLDDDEYGELQQFMMQNPEAGAIVRGSGGVRKLRWRREETPLAARWRGQAWRFTRDLFSALSAERVLDADVICQDEAGERAS
jgi:hypothetical protein